MQVLESAANRSLDRIRDIFGLSEAELAELFSVQRQSVVGWREHGIPDTRRASVERLLGLANVLHREIIPSRIAEIVRTKDAWLGDRSILEAIRIDGAESVYGYLHRLFSYAG